MDSKIVMDGLIELLKQGGPMALWGVAIWMGIRFLQVLSVVWGLVYVVCRLLSTLDRYHQCQAEVLSKRITLVSKRLEDKFEKVLMEFTTNVDHIAEKLNTLCPPSSKT